MTRLTTCQKSSSSTLRPANSAQDVLDLTTGFWISQAIYVAAKLGIADSLRGGPKSAAELAAMCDVHACSLYRVLRALASLQIFAENAEGKFALTPAAECLTTDESGSLRAYAIMMGEQWVWRSCGEMLHSVQTGRSGFEHVFGAPVFDYWQSHPESAGLSAEGLSSRGAAENFAVIAAYPFPKTGTVVDIGGGQGTLLGSVLTGNPGLHGLLFDLPHVVKTAEPLLQRANVRSRCNLLSGNFFSSIPSEGDVYILKKVIHDWPDEQARIILKNCREAIPEHGRLLLIELVIPDGNEPSFGKMLDLLMLAYAGGRERTQTEYRDLLVSAEFRLQRTVSTASPVSIMEAVPI